jgi:multisubunit Na+/H+ antiporter MnhC subunit
MFEIIVSVVVITVLVMFFIYMFLSDDLDSGTRIMMGISIFFTAIILSLLCFLLNTLL